MQREVECGRAIKARTTIAKLKADKHHLARNLYWSRRHCQHWWSSYMAMCHQRNQLNYEVALLKQHLTHAMAALRELEKCQ
jgi:hypothetical protein